MNRGEKTLLLADVGGTNTRVAVARGGVPTDVRHFQNADFPDFYALLGSYVQAGNLGQIDGLSVAMAGPVRGDQGRITNRDWHITTAKLRQVFGAPQAVLLNDLTALGYAVPSLTVNSLTTLMEQGSAAPNGQALVVGIGTGFNLCPILTGPDGKAQCLEVEMGHAALPAPLRDDLTAHIGAAADQFPTLEHLFSGAGLAQFHRVRTGKNISAKAIVQAHEAGDTDAGQTLDIATSLLGLLCGELAYHYMPMDGIYFAGSVARGILRPEFAGNLTVTGHKGGKVGNLIDKVPKRIILDDAAALSGCLAALDKCT